MLQAVGPCSRLFARNTKGNVAVLFGLAIIPIMITVGGAVDYGRALLVRERMADAADAAALAIGSWPGLTEAQLKAKAQQFFNANYPPSELGTAGAIDVKFVGDNINVTLKGSVPTTFMELANIPSIDVGVETVVTRRQRNIELALVLDTTGSMGQSGKMSAMQSAAKKMVETLFNGQATSNTLNVSVVPFAAAVNVGTDNKDADWIDKNAKSTVATEDYDSNSVKTFNLYKDMQKYWSWGGCVRERNGDDYELTDATPSTGTAASLFAPYLAPDEPDSADNYSYSNSYIQDGNCGENKKKNRTDAVCQAYTGKYSNPKKDSYSASGPNLYCPPQPITALTNTKSDVTSAIDLLQPNGNTVIPAGLLWGWRVLSPDEPFTEGKAYDEEERIKAIVLLTDGENSVSGGGNGQNKSSYNAFGYAKNGHLGNKNGTGAEDELDSKTLTVCSNIKAKGILIYTIGFQVNSNTQRLLKSCATKDDMFFNSPTNDQLASIFQDIAQGLGDLRVAQ